MCKCERCGKSIEGKRGRARYCSLGCRLLGKRKEPVYVYAITWGPNLGNQGIKRYQVHQGRGRYLIHPFSFDFIPLPQKWNPNTFNWRFVGIRHDPIRKSISRKSGYWIAEEAFPDKYYSLKEVEIQWRDLRSQTAPCRALTISAGMISSICSTVRLIQDTKQKSCLVLAWMRLPQKFTKRTARKLWNTILITAAMQLYSLKSQQLMNC